VPENRLRESFSAGFASKPDFRAENDSRSRFLQRPVISVGNISMGGRGKTPVAGLIARLLVEAGERPAILSRGYKRRRPEDGVVIVSDGRHVLADVDRAGDEPLMLARETPGAIVLVCEMRAIAGALAEDALGATVHVLDDGFQHRAVARDIDLVVIRTSDLNGRRMPFGRLRESPSALERADGLIIESDGSEESNESEESSKSWRPDQAVFRLRRSLGSPVALEAGARAMRIERGDKVVAACGIAEPDRFTRSLSADGWTVAATLPFPDHHAFSRHDLQEIADAVKRHGASGVLTTAKDAMRLLPLRPLPVPMAFVPLHVAIEPAARFRDWLFGRLAEARA
jgi:tetraacyldisaccharide 4'-kinase